jgi:AraC-like DNA-binding protein
VAQANLRSIRPGRERIPAFHAAPRHRHREAYALVAVRGAFDQASYAGRVTARAGQLIVQPTLDCHANLTGAGGAEILRLPWAREEGLGGLYDLDDLDALVRLAERDPEEAGRQAAAELAAKAPRPPRLDCWSDALARDLANGAVSRLADWAERRGLAPDTLPRGFARLYGTTPARFRHELKVRRAWLAVTGGGAPLAGIAAEAGFADQPHMTREIRRLTGASPGHWRLREYPGLNHPLRSP